MASNINLPVPENCEILVKEGAVVKKGAVLAERSEGKEKKIALFELLGVSAGKVSEYLKAAEGDRIERKQVIAAKKGFFSTTRVRNPVAGTLRVLGEEPGYVSIERDHREKLRAPAAGAVLRADKQGVIIEVRGTTLEGKDGSGNAEGELFVLPEDGGERIFRIDKKVRGKIVLSEKISGTDAAKIGALGGKAVVGEEVGEEVRLPFLIIESIDSAAQFKGREGEIWNEGERHFLFIET